ncbi:PREDICTED: uncharacterized protein LOC104591322 [Nelumbo nucifera]|uniref:Uncharacterized protein LOC104591322 n=1 Tax=Nelumbo nucifera TaxID=4432 RepID=A0A1U7Z597_NELNU|nr:PREDICTED: uncharacterized protein LOC104591322 [Nelumbo nucifera]
MSAMTGGWNPQLILKAWHREGFVLDEQSRSEYLDAMREAGMSPEVIVGEAEEVMEALPGIDLLVVDRRRKDFARVLKHAKLSTRGAVLNQARRLGIRRRVFVPEMKVVEAVATPGFDWVLESSTPSLPKKHLDLLIVSWKIAMRIASSIFVDSPPFITCWCKLVCS